MKNERISNITCNTEGITEYVLHALLLSWLESASSSHEEAIDETDLLA
jgi:hypothetical protein